MISFAKPADHRRSWTPADDEVLRMRCEAGEALPEIARNVGRTQEACRSRANKLGIPCRSSRAKPAAGMPIGVQASAGRTHIDPRES